MSADKTENLRIISIMTLSMIIGILLFLIVSVLVNYFNGPFIKDSGLGDTVFYILLAISILIVGGARLAYDKKILSLKSSPGSLTEKMNNFRAINITHMALCEMPAILSLISFMLFGGYLLLIPVFFSVAEMIVRYPSTGKMEEIANTASF